MANLTPRSKEQFNKAIDLHSSGLLDAEALGGVMRNIFKEKQDASVVPAQARSPDTRVVLHNDAEIARAAADVGETHEEWRVQMKYPYTEEGKKQAQRYIATRPTKVRLLRRPCESDRQVFVSD